MDLHYTGKFKEYNQELLSLYHHFHKYPELALNEFRTSSFIREYMEKLGYEIRQVEPTGLIAEHPSLKNKSKLVVLRAEMDALPIQEKTNLPYASCNEGCMHACGHDAILAAALILAKIAADPAADLPVRLRFLFEPAEEIGEGARRMLDAGALETGEGTRETFDAGALEIREETREMLDAGVLEIGEDAHEMISARTIENADAFLMFHYAGDEEFGMAVHEGQASSMIGSMQIHVHGKSSHWCEAHKGIDAIYAASLVISAIHDLNRDYKGAGKSLVGIGSVHGGEYANIIADHVILNGNIRACRDEDFYCLKEKLSEAFLEIEKQTGAKIQMEFPKEPVLSFANDPELTEIAKTAGEDIFKDRFKLEGEDELFLFGDNAYRYFQKTRGLFTVFLAAVPGENHPLHHPKFRIDERILPYSVETLYEMIKKIY